MRESSGPACGQESAYFRRPRPVATRLDAPLSTDVFGTSLVCYARDHRAPGGGATYVSTSVRALARQLGQVTLNPLAPAEALSLGLVLRDETVFNEIRSIPPHSTLHPDGSISTQPGPRSISRITDAAAAAHALRDLLRQVIVDLEPHWPVHCAGLTGGRDSRILAALPKALPHRWHWLTVSGKDDAEHAGSAATAARLGLKHATWQEWTADFLDGRHRASADLANGIGAVSDYTLLRAYFERYRSTSLTEMNGADVPLWIGTLADSLFAGTYFDPPARTIAGALAPRTTHLPRVLTADVLDRVAAMQPYYDSNPFDFTPGHDDETACFVRLFTRGRLFVCRGLACFDHGFSPVVSPYLHPAIVDLALAVDPRVRKADAVRERLLAQLGADLTAPSAFGYRAPAYAQAVCCALAEEAARATAGAGAATTVVRADLLDRLRDGELIDLHDLHGGAAAGTASAQPAYRVHADLPPWLFRSLRDYEHLLTFLTFLNLVTEDGVSIQ